MGGEDGWGAEGYWWGAAGLGRGGRVPRGLKPRLQGESLIAALEALRHPKSTLGRGSVTGAVQSDGAVE